MSTSSDAGGIENGVNGTVAAADSDRPIGEAAPEENEENTVAYWKEQVQITEEKLRTWQGKAKKGVDGLRQRVTALSADVQERDDRISILENQLLRENCSLEQQSPSTRGAERYHSTWLPVSIDTFSEGVLEKADVALQQFLLSAEAVRRLQPLAPAAEDDADDKAKRRMEQTLRMQTKSMESLQANAEQLRNRISKLETDLQKSGVVLAERNATVALLESQVDSVQTRYDALLAEHSACRTGLDMEEEDRVRLRCEGEMEAMRQEFSERENIVHESHRDELERLLVRHEQEINVLRMEQDDHLREAINEIRRDLTAEHAQTFNSAEKMRMEVSAQNDKLKALVQEKDARIAELSAANERALSSSHQRRSAPAQTPEEPSVGGALVFPQQWTLPQALSRIKDLEMNAERLAEQLCEAKQELIERNFHSQPPGDSAAERLEGQKMNYLRTVVVKLICRRSDDSVVVNLLPVLISLLKLDDDSIKEMYIANPSLIRR